LVKKAAWRDTDLLDTTTTQKVEQAQDNKVLTVAAGTTHIAKWVRRLTGIQCTKHGWVRER